jgi:DNA-binding NarL/FixJ family response regulator
VIRALVIADSGAVFAAVTSTLWLTGAVEIVGYASGAANVSAIGRSTLPDVVLVDAMRWPGLALKRIAEVRASAPAAVVVGLCESADDAWVVDGLHAGASVVVPRRLDAPTLAAVLRSVTDAPTARPVRSAA